MSIIIFIIIIIINLTNNTNASIIDAYTLSADLSTQESKYPAITDDSLGSLVFTQKYSWLYIASNETFDELDVQLTVSAAGGINPKYEITKGDGSWGEYKIGNDGTIKWQQSGVIKFDVSTTGFSWQPYSITEITSSVGAAYWLRIQRTHNNFGDVYIKYLLPIDNPILVVSTTSLSVQDFIDSSTSLVKNFTLSNDGTKVLAFTYAFTPSTTSLSIERVDGQAVTTDIPAKTSVDFRLVYDPSVKGIENVDLTFNCPLCLLGLEKTISITAEGKIPIHLSDVTLTAGNYKIGDSIDIVATFDTGVSVNDSRVAIYARLQVGDSLSGSIFSIAALSTPINTNSSSLIFTIPVDDNIPNNRTLFITSSSFELPSGAVIKKTSTDIVLSDEAQNSAIPDPNPTNILIDGKRPSIISVTSNGGTFSEGDNITLTLTFDEPVDIINDGALLNFDIGSANVSAAANNFVGPNSIIEYVYTVTSGVQSRTGINVISISASNSGGNFQDSFGNTASTTMQSLFLQNILVDALSPTISTWQVPTSSKRHGAGSILGFTASMSENIEFLNIRLVLDIGGTSYNVTTSSFSPTNSLAFFYLVPTNVDGTLTSASLVIDDYLRDLDTNNLLSGSTDATGFSNVIIDTTPPSLTSVTFPDTAQSYTLGTTFVIIVTFDENIDLQGSISLEFQLKPNGPTVESGFGVKDGITSNKLRFSYGVQDVGTDLLYEGITNLKIIQKGGGIVSDIVDSGSGSSITLPLVLTYNQNTANALKIDTRPNGSNDPNANNQNGTSTGTLIGGIAAAAVGSALLAFLGFWSYQRYQRYLREKLPDFQKYAFQFLGKNDPTKKKKNKDEKSRHETRAIKELREIMLNTTSDVAFALIECVPHAKLNEAIRAVLYFYAAHDQNEKSVQFIKRCVSVKIQEAMKAGKSNLFRTDNSATKSLAIFFRMIGLPYLFTIVGDTIRTTTTIKVELDPTRMASEQDSDLSRYTLLQSAQMVMVNVIKKLPQMPKEFRELARHLDREARFYAEDNPDRVAQIALAGLVFLRYICPCLSAPSAFGFLEERPDADKRRLLTLVTKTIQNLANGVKFGGKEPYMQRLNDFIDANSEKMDKYLNDLISQNGKTVPEELERPQPPSYTSQWCLEVLLSLFQSNFNEISPKVGATVRDAISRVVASSLPVIPPKKEWQLFGYLTKRGGSVKSWRKRFFIVKDLFVWYCKRDSSKAPLGVICLEGCAILYTEDGFLIDHPYARTYHIRTQSTAERDKWVKVLKEKIENAEVLKEQELQKRLNRDGDSNSNSQDRKMEIEMSSAHSRQVSGMSSAISSANHSRQVSTESKDADSDEEEELLLNNPLSGLSETHGLIQKQLADISEVDEERKSKFQINIIEQELEHAIKELDEKDTEEAEREELKKNGWEVYHTDDGKPYYVEKETGVSRWTKPVFDTDVKIKTIPINEISSTSNTRASFVAQPSMDNLLGEKSSSQQTIDVLVDEEESSKQLPPGWQKFSNDQGLPYYYNSATQETQWDFPVLQ